MVYCFPFSHTFLKFCIRFLLTEMIFNDVCHDVLNIQSGSAYLLWDKAGSCHTWRGVNLEHIDLVAFRNNVIYAYNSFAIQNIIDGRSQLLYPLSQFRAEASWCDFSYLTFLFGIEVKEFIFAYDFSDREYH